jgi:hypothetical protein
MFDLAWRSGRRTVDDQAEIGQERMSSQRLTCQRLTRCRVPAEVALPSV